MARLFDVPLLGNPLPKAGGQKSTKRSAGSKKGKTMAKRKKGKGKRNPLGSLKGVKGPLLKGAAIGAGVLLAEVVLNHVPLPESLQGGVGEAAVTAAVGFGLAFAAKKTKYTAPYADNVRDGAIGYAVYKLVAPKALPMLAFTDHAKLHAAVDVNALRIVSAANAQQTKALENGEGGDTKPGDAFVLSRGGITTADRAPRDTLALAGVGDSYVQERPGFSGAPNGLQRPWGNSIYTRN